MQTLSRILLVLVSFIVGAMSIAASVETSEQGPTFVHADTRPAGVKDAVNAIVGALNSSDIETLQEYFDFTALALKAGDELFETDREYRAFVKGFESSERNSLTGTIKQIEKSDGEAVFMGYVERAEGVMAQVRLDLGEFGTEYVEYMLEEADDDKYRVVDWYQLSSGRMVSETVAIATKVMADPNPSVVQRLLGIKKVDDNQVKQIRELGNARNRGDYVDANRLFEALPLEIRTTRVFLEIGIGVAGFLDGEDVYRARLNDLAEHHGDDPSAAHLLIDHYYYEGNAEKALACIDAMERSIGLDGYTTFLKGNIYLVLAEDVEKAEALYKYAIEIEPGYDDPYLSLASLHLMKKDYASAVDVYRQMEGTFGFQFSDADFFDTPENDAFKASAQFKDWMASR